MSKLYIDKHGEETVVAVVKDGRIEEIDVDNSSVNNLVGNIYKGVVENVIPGIQAAFVNIGLNKNAYLFTGENAEATKDNLAERTYNPLLQNLKKGDVIMVQIAKEQFGTKGVRITSNITLPGRYLVMTPYNYSVSVSQKITDDTERARLTAIVEKFKKANAGYIIRTAANGVTEDDIKKEIDALYQKCLKVLEDFKAAAPGEIVYEESDILGRALRDMVSDTTDEIVTDNKRVYDAVLKNAEIKKNGIRVTYEKSADISEEISLVKQLENALSRRVDLINGAYLIIDRTEALTVIDVNTGKFIGGSSLEETVFETNLCAAVEIARQLRLRNISGIIIVDFINMEIPEHVKEVVDCLTEAVKEDRIKTTVLGMTSLGLVEMTRKKKKCSIMDVFTQPCQYCSGDGYVISDEFVIIKLRAALIKFIRENPSAEVIMIRVNPAIFAKLFSNNVEMDELSEFQKLRVYLEPDELTPVQNFRIINLGSGIVDLPDRAKYWL